MTLRRTGWLITSDITPETARYTGCGWVLSWLPGRMLTREQAMTGMVLDETLSDPDPEDYVLAMEIAAIRAADLGLELAKAVVLLHARIVERDRRQAGADCRIAVPTTPAA
ncbi:hypothetical protein ACIBG0_30450 [Nocardia sp. NPDC050630]|uniref:hypothetical protein n=1 Tax=Nocardia sp. NPDC050630 TaxID=3364321 RepID=UPI0037B1F20D